MKAMISTRTDESTIAILDEIAANMEVTRSDVINEALQRYIDYVTWFKAEVQKGIDDADAGRVISHEEAMARFDKI